MNNQNIMITLDKLMEWNACKEGIEWLKNKNIQQIDYEELIKELIAEDQYKWCYWLIAKLLNKTNLIKLAIYSAESVIHIFENEHPGDDRPRKAIQAAKKYLLNKNTVTTVTTDTADAYAYAADAAYAAYTAYAAYADATYAAAYAAYAADAAANAAYAADAADAAAYAYAGC
jgi:hypothetical protein